MKVAICSDYFYPIIGGVTTHIENLALNLQKNGHEVIIITKGSKFNGNWTLNWDYNKNPLRDIFARNGGLITSKINGNGSGTYSNVGRNQKNNGGRSKSRKSLKLWPGIVSGIGFGIVSGMGTGIGTVREIGSGIGSGIGTRIRPENYNSNSNNNSISNNNSNPGDINEYFKEDSSKPEYLNGIEIIRLSSFFRATKSLEVPHTRELEDIFRRINPDVIHAHHAFSPVSLFSLSVGKKLGIKSVLTTHSIQFFYDYDYIWMPSSYILFPYRRYINYADKIVAVSNAAASFISHFTNKDVSVIPNGVNVSDIAPKKKDFDGKNLLFVGRFVYRKGLHLLLQAMEDVVKEDNEAKLTIVGKGYFNHIIKILIRALDLQNNVVIREGLAREELIREYQRSNVFLMPSIYGESFGIVLLEAMASKTPIIASNQGGIKEIIKHEQTGLLIERNKVKAMSENILRLLNDKEYSKKLSSNAYRDVKKFDWSKVTKEIEIAYNS